MKKILLTFVISFIVSNAYSETASEESIVKLLKLTGADKMGEQMINKMMPVMRQSLPDAPEEFFVVFKKEANVDYLIDMIVPIYQKYLSQSDVDELNKFYSTDIGKKIIQVQPLMLQESMLAGEMWGKAAGQRASITIQNRSK